MSKLGSGGWNHAALRATGLEIVIECNFPQRNHDAMIPQQTNFVQQVPATAIKLIQCGFVSRRRAPYGCSDVTVFQVKAIPTKLRFGLTGKSITIQGLVQPIPAPITGKDTPRPISTMCRRRQPQNIEPSVTVSESWNRTSPVDPITVLFPFLSRNRLSIQD